MIKLFLCLGFSLPLTLNCLAAQTSWHIGGKIYFEERSGSDFIGTREITMIAKTVLGDNLSIQSDAATDNAKILIIQEDGGITMKSYEEKSRPGVG